MKILSIIFVIFCLSFARSAVLSAQTNLTTLNSTVSNATGTASISFNTDTYILTVSLLTFTNLTNNATSAAFYGLTAQQNNGTAGLIAQIPGFPLNLTTGNVTNQVLNLTVEATYDQTFFNASGRNLTTAGLNFLAGLANSTVYVQVFANSTAEIRGFFPNQTIPTNAPITVPPTTTPGPTTTPKPSSASLMIVSAVLLVISAIFTF